MASSRRTAAIVATVGVVAWLVNAVILWAAGGGLGHDEAQYASSARDLVEGHPLQWNYLPIGMSAVALPGVLMGGGERALHVVPLVIGVGYLAAAGLLARTLFGDAVAAWVICVLAASTSIARRAVELLSDLPSTACLIAGAGLIVVELTRDPAPRRRLLLAAPCFAAAFYVRYGSVFPIAVVSGAALLVGWRAILRRPGLVLATAALFGALLVPFFLRSIDLTGSALGVFEETSDVLGAAPMGSALVTYLTTNPLLYYGVAITPVMIAGLAAIRRGRDPRVRALWLIGVGHVVVLGLTPVPQSRYIFFGMTLLVILGVDEIHRLASARSPATRRALGGVAVAVLAISWVIAAVTSRRILTSRDRRMEPTFAVIAAIRADAAGAPCQVIARRTTQLQWYTGCAVVYEAPPDVLARVRVYHVVESGVEWQPAGVEGRPGVPRTILERPGALVVTRLDPPPPPPPPPSP